MNKNNFLYIVMLSRWICWFSLSNLVFFKYPVILSNSYHLQNLDIVMILNRVFLAFISKQWHLYYSLHFSTKVPNHPQANLDLTRLPPETKIDQETIQQLESISLVKFGNETGIKIVEEAIRFADQITLLNTEGVEPMVSVLEERYYFIVTKSFDSLIFVSRLKGV